MEDIVTIDGPTSSGKNSVGFLLAKKLRYKYIDSGMIYRAGCLKLINQNISSDNLEKILDIYKNLDVEFENNDSWKMFLDKEDVTDRLHTPEISRLVPVVSAYHQVRELVKVIQKRVAKNGKIVMGGRDIGTEIFPNAKYKFWLTASVEERANRRFKQLVAKDPTVKFEDVLSDMKKRDEYDRTRDASPMRIPKDAYVIDNTKFSIEQTVEEMLKNINA